MTRAFQPVRAANGGRRSSIPLKSRVASTGWKPVSPWGITSTCHLLPTRYNAPARRPWDEWERLAVDYRPQPIDTTQVQLEPSLLELTEYLARNTHEVW